jgi:hypothetical protein
MRPDSASRLGDYRANLGAAQCSAQWTSIVVLLEESNFGMGVIESERSRSFPCRY